MNRFHASSTAIALLVLCLLTTGLFVGLGQALGADQSPSPANGKVVLRIGWTDQPDNLNPFIGYQTASWEIWGLEYDYLFNYAANGNIEPQLAAELPTEKNGGMSDGGKVWTIHIRPNAKWNDGTPLTAEDVAWTYNYSIDNHIAQWGVVTRGIEHVEVVDPTTVRLICSYPKADMLVNTLPILPKHIWEHVDPHVAQHGYAEKLPLVGSGPFKVVEFKRNGYAHLVQNQYYWGEKPTVDEIYFENYTNADTMCADLRLGTIDAAEGVPTAQYDRLKQDKNLTVIKYNYYTWDYATPNCYTGKSLGNPVLRDVKFRQALATAIDNNEVVNTTWNGFAVPGTTMMPPHEWSNPDYHWEPPADVKYSFDPQKAGDMLTAAGYPLENGVRLNKEGQPIVLRVWARSACQESQTEGRLLTGWWEGLGLKIKYSVLDDGQIDDAFYNYEGDTYVPDYDIYLWDWDGYRDPASTLGSWLTDQIENYNESCWSNADFDRLYDQQQRTLDPNARAKIIQQMQEIMYKDACHFVLTYPLRMQAYNTQKWTGWTRIMAGNGPAFFNGGDNRDTYIDLRPVASSDTSGGLKAKGLWIAGAVVVVLVVLGGVVWLTIRRRSEVEEIPED